MPKPPPGRSSVEGPPEECANCGASIPQSARACPECGADEKTGWREINVYDSLDLPEEAYADKNDRHRPRPRSPWRINGIVWYWWCLAATLIVLLVFGARGLR